MIKQFVNSFFNSNSFIYINIFSRKCLLIDCGDVVPIINYIKENNFELIAVLITHTHYDHIYGLNKLISHYPNLLVYTSGFGEQGLQSEKLNLSKYHDDSFILNKTENIRVINTGSLLLSGINIEIFSTHGHDPSCLTYRVESYLFTGDSYLPEYKLTSIFPKSNKIAALKSEAKIKSLLNTVNFICPGHGRIIESAKIIS